jgi:hypothetical protein
VQEGFDFQKELLFQSRLILRDKNEWFAGMNVDWEGG